MLTNDDIAKIIKAHKEVFLTKEEGVTKEEIRTLTTSVDSYKTAVDGYMKKTDDYHKELGSYKHKAKDLENWVTQAAPKVGIDYKP